MSEPCVIVCAPEGFTYRTVMPCPYCKQQRRFVVTSYLWYGPERTCGGCGNHWSDGYRRRLSNKQKALNRDGFHERWVAARTRREMWRWLRTELEAA
jgi:hypothetical protein